MQTLTTILVALTFLLAIVPSTQAGTDTDHYLTGGGVVVEGIGGTTAFACADAEEDCDLDGDGERDVPWAIGATELSNPDGPVQNVVVSTSDDIFGSDAAMVVCVYSPESDWTHCGPPDDVHSDVTCGTTSLLAWPYSSADIMVGVYTVFVSDELEVCGSSSGTATAMFF